MSESVKLKVANTEFEIGDILEIVPKMDYDAPSGFQQHGTTKLLMKGIAENHSPIFDEDLQMWDTGFDVIHPSNARIPQAEKEARVEAFNKYIRKPYEDKFRKELDATNDNFYSEYIYTVETGRKLDTRNEKDRLDLYFMLKDGAVCEEKESDYYLKKAKYNIRNVKEAQTLEEKKNNTKFEAIGVLSTLLNTFEENEGNEIYTILEWINITNLRGSDKGAVRNAVMKKFENEKIGYDMSKRFLQAYEMTKDDSKKEVMEMFSVLNKLSQRRKIEYKKRQYFIEGQLLGNNLKEAAEKAVTNEELRDLVDKAYQSIL